MRKNLEPIKESIIFVAFSINLHIKCVSLVMLGPPPPCMHLFALVLTPPPLGAHIINGRPLNVRKHTF